MKWTAFYADRYHDSKDAFFDLSGGELPDGAYVHRYATNKERERWYLWQTHGLTNIKEDEVPETIKTLMLLL